MDELKERVRVNQAEMDRDRSVGSLFKELSTDSSTLVRHEIELAKAEMSEKIHRTLQNGKRMGIGVGILFIGFFILFEAVNRGLTAFFATFMPLGIAVWLAPLLISAVLITIGAVLLRKGRTSMKRETLVPRQTAETLKEDAQWLKRKVS